MLISSDESRSFDGRTESATAGTSDL